MREMRITVEDDEEFDYLYEKVADAMYNNAEGFTEWDINEVDH